MENNILLLFEEFLEKQDLLSKLTEEEVLHEYGYSEIHVIQAVGNLETPNVTAIADYLKLTKGAVSKITRKLMSKGVLASYAKPDNKQKIFFRLTSSGRVLFDEHDRRHQLWLKRDRQFLQQYPPEQLAGISEFMQAFNRYLEQRINEFGNQKEE